MEIILVSITAILAIMLFMVLIKYSLQHKQIKAYKIDMADLNNNLNEANNQTQRSNLLLDQAKQIQANQLESYQSRIAELKDDTVQYKSKLEIYISDIRESKADIATLQTQLKEQKQSMTEKLELLQNSEAKLKVEFENVANKIFENNSKKFDERNTQSLNFVLNPVKEQLRDFKQKVEDVYDKESTARGALQNELKTLKELNLKMTTEAHNLTNALKSSTKQQGAWGEMVLESVLEKSGLREGLEYFREYHTTDEHGKAYRPDVVVKLPDNRDIIIDAKNSLIAYNDYMAATDEVAKKTYLKSHITSIKNHIKGLGVKDYEKLKGLNTLDFIFMFIPIEGALLLALDNDPSLYDEAFRQKIILVSPTTLLVALRAVENTWRYEKQAKSIEQVYDRATKLYDKAAMMIETFEKVGKNIERASDEYKKAFGQLQGSGGLISQATLLKKVSNIQPKKEIDENLVENSLNN